MIFNGGPAGYEIKLVDFLVLMGLRTNPAAAAETIVNNLVEIDNKLINNPNQLISPTNISYIRCSTIIWKQNVMIMSKQPSISRIKLQKTAYK